MNNPYYAGIGRRDIPQDIENIMIAVGYTYASQGRVLRSGGAKGSDAAFETGAKMWADEVGISYDRVMEIYIPWNGFNGLSDNNPGYHLFNKFMNNNSMNIANSLIAKHISYSQSMSNSVAKFMQRNYLQIAGKEGSPMSGHVICWTHDGDANTGGTGFAKNIALDLGVEVYDLVDPAIRARVEKFLNENYPREVS